MKKILFVTNELFPFSKGGIGRLLYNYIIWNSSSPQPASISVLMLDRKPGASWAGSDLKNVKIFDAEKLGSLTRLQTERLRAAQSPTYQMLVERSTMVSNSIEELRASYGLTFDIIEFPDLMGLAYASIIRKAEGSNAFVNTTISVRLHSSWTLIQAAERGAHSPGEWYSAIMDIERFSLRHADLIVGHLETIVDQNQKFFGFDDNWRKRCTVEFPPILLVEDELEEPSTVQQKSDSQIFVFSSRLQPCKRPDLFLRAAAAFLRQTENPTVQFVVASYGWDEGYIAWLGSLVPPDLADQIVIKNNLSHQERAALLSIATVVIPSIWESLCVFAYESILLGRRLILNESCLAFGDAPFWVDGENCIMFDGTVVGLSNAMQRSIGFSSPSNISLPATTPYWTKKSSGNLRVPKKLCVDLIDTRVKSHPGDASELGDFVDLPIGRMFQFVDRLYFHPPKDSDLNASISARTTVIDNFGASLEAGAIIRALEESAADFILLVDGPTQPSTECREFVCNGFVSEDIDIIGFTARDTVTGRWWTPFADCPNLLSLNFNSRLLPVLVRREVLMGALNELRQLDDLIVDRAVTGLVLGGASACTLDLAMFIDGKEYLHRFPVFHHMADLLSQERRKKMPHLAALSGSPACPIGRPYVDEWAAIDYSRDISDGMIVASRARGEVSFDEIYLENLVLLDDRWSADVRFSSATIRGLRLGDVHTTVKITPLGVEVAVLNINGDDVRVDLPSLGQEPLLFRSFNKQVPATLLGHARCRIIVGRLVDYIVESLPKWCLGSFRRFHVRPQSWLEDTVAPECQLFSEWLSLVVQVPEISTKAAVP
jgi:glycosyltransferase involved in cell wall biosynthesis